MPGRPCRMLAVARRLCATGAFQVPRKSAPNDSTYRALARSNVGSCSRPKLSRFARRSTSSLEQLEGRRGAGAPNRSRNSVDEIASRARARPRSSRRATPARRVGQGVELRHELGDRGVPADRLERRRCRARPVRLQRLRDPVRMIGDLNRRLAARAQRALVDRMRRVALELLRQAHARRRPPGRCGPTSTSPCMTRTVVPQPARHSGHTPGFTSAMPGISSSSGMKRMSWFSGLPQLGERRAVPVTAVSLMNVTAVHGISSGRSGSRSTPACCGGSRRRTPWCDRRCARATVCLRHVAVARGAVHLRADMRRVIEAHVRFVREPVDALPGNVDARASGSRRPSG